MTADERQLKLNFDDPVEYLAPPDRASSRFTNRSAGDPMAPIDPTEATNASRRPAVALIVQSEQISAAMEVVLKALFIGLDEKGPDK